MDAAVGTLAKAQEALRSMLAATTAFRTWDGRNLTVEQAKAKIFVHTMPLVPVEDLPSVRPFAVIWSPMHAVRWRKQASPNSFRPSGTLIIEFHRTPPALDAEDPGAAEREFFNTLGAIAQTGNPNSPGLADLVGTAGYLMLEEIRADGVFRAEPDDMRLIGDADLCYMEVEW